MIDLLVSLAKEYPAGSILTIATDKDAMFEERSIEGAPPLHEGERPTELILDGQQRITSLYGALVGGQASRFFLDVQAIIDEASVEEAIRHVPIVNQQGLDAPEVQAKKLWFPLDRTFQDRNYLKWMREVSRARGGSVEETHHLEDRMEAVFDKVVEKIQSYEFPVVTLVAGTSPAAVCLIFSKVNSTGVKLTLFDLLAAQWWAHGVRLRTRWSEARAQYLLIRRFLRTDGTSVLRAIALKEVGQCTEKPILSLPAKAFADHWNEILVGLNGVLTLLSEECGVLQPKYLPYMPSLLPLACVWPKVASARGAEQANLRNKLKQWFWCVSFSGRYESGGYSKVAKDYKELDAWICGGDVPNAVAQFEFNLDSLDRTTRSNSALYRTVLAAVLSRRPLDFHKASPITSAQFLEGVDDHHVFPQRCVAVEDKEHDLVQCILNRALIDSLTNKRISNQNPSQYLDDIAQASEDSTRLDEILASHMLPSGEGSPLRTDDFDAFIAARRETIATEIARKTGWTAGGRQAADRAVIRLRDALSKLGEETDDDTDLEEGFYGFDAGLKEDSPEEDDYAIWFGRWDQARARSETDGWLWIQLMSDERVDQAKWEGLFRELGAASQFEIDEYPTAAIRLQPEEAARVIARFLEQLRAEDE